MPAGSEKSEQNNSIVALDRFIQSTRDSGYKSTASAISELVDNSIQAGATDIQIIITRSLDSNFPLMVAVTDNGSGMDSDTLVESLRFGGTTRFNSRRGLGRFGMGLPNASLSQSQRVDVFTWQQANQPIWSYLDVDEIAAGDVSAIPEPELARPPSWSDACLTDQSGTVVMWSRCDRLDHKKEVTLESKLHEMLGRMFRHFIWSDEVTITVNNKAVLPIDPLFKNERAIHHGSRQFQDLWQCELRIDPSNPSSPTSTIFVEFVELPVARWHGLSNPEKRAMGISNGAGVSIVRGQREVDFGWFFFGSKRRENYDDWWRCEIRFEPELDELFGITHTKQQIRPTQELKEILTPYMEEMAKALSQRTRQAHQDVKQTVTNKSAAAAIATKKHQQLTPIVTSRGKDLLNEKRLQDLKSRNPVLHELTEATASSVGEANYHLVGDTFESPRALEGVKKDQNHLTLINTRHALYKKLLSPLAEGKLDLDKAHTRLELVLLAAVHAEATFTKKSDKAAIDRFMEEWSNSMSVLLSSS